MSLEDAAAWLGFSVEALKKRLQTYLNPKTGRSPIMPGITGTKAGRLWRIHVVGWGDDHKA